MKRMPRADCKCDSPTPFSGKKRNEEMEDDRSLMEYSKVCRVVIPDCRIGT